MGLKVKSLINKKNVILLLLLAVLLSPYILLFGKYKTELLDDAWSTSFIYNYIEKGVSADTIFEGEGQNGVVTFGMTQVLVYGPILHYFGYTKANVHVLSVIFSLLSCILFTMSLKNVVKGVSYRYFFVIYILSEAILSMAFSARIEAMNLFLISLVMYLLSLEKRSLITSFLTGFIALLAVENHPLGSIVFVYILSYIVFKWHEDRKYLISNLRYYLMMSLSVMLFIPLYFLLHPNGFAQLGQVSGSTSYFSIYNYIYSYLINTRYFRHVPAAVVTTGAFAFLLYKRYWKVNIFPILAFAFAIIYSFVLSRSNLNYVAYIVPACVFVVSVSLSTLNKRLGHVLLSIICLFYLAQYIVLYKQNMHFNMKDYTTTLKEFHLGNYPLYASANEWFVFMDHDFISTTNWNLLDRQLEKVYLIEEDEYRKTIAGTEYESQLMEKYNYTYIDRRVYNAETYELYLLEIKR